MGVTKWKKGLGLQKSIGPSNKHGLTDFPEAYTVRLPNGHQVYVSIPQIDRISFLGVVPFGSNDLLTEIGPKTFAAHFKATATKEEARLKLEPDQKSSQAKGAPKSGEVRGYLEVGDRLTRVEVAAQPILGGQKSPMAWRLRFDWCPRKSGPLALTQIKELLAVMLDLDIKETSAWLATSKVTRLDIAVDVIDLERRDLFTRLVPQQKLQTWGVWGKGIETINHYSGMAKKGSASLTVYDKRQEQLDKAGTKGKTPKYGTRKHLRVERRHKSFSKKELLLADLPQRSDLLAGPIVRLMRDLPQGPSKMSQQLAAASTLWFGWNALSGTLEGEPLEAWKLMKNTPDPDFWDVDRLAEHWPQAVTDAGFDL